MDLPHSERWREINEILVEAQARPAEERAAYLDEACGEDEALRREVETLLAADAAHEPFFERDAATLADPFLPEGPGTPDGPDADRQVGPYRLQERIGEGGSSLVYRAERADEQFERTVAVKVLRAPVAERREAADRFRAERQILASLSHPHLAEVYDGGVLEDGRPYLVMEYVDGRPITEHCRAEGLTVDERLRLVRQAAAAVQAAHEQLVVHRDLKPSNVLVERDTGAVKLLDFGIAKILGELPGGPVPATQTGRHPMTPAYAAPEQVAGDPIGVATDTYALGALLYELLAERRPHEPDGRSPYAVARAVREEDPPAPSAAVEDSDRRAVLTGDLDAIIMTALRKAPGERYDTVEALVEDLDRYFGDQPVRANRGGWAYRARKFARRNRGPIAGTALAVTLLAGFALYHVQRLSAERDQARQAAQKAEQVSGFLIDLMQGGNPYRQPGNTEGALTVQTVLDRGADRLDELDDQPAVQAEMRTVIGNTYEALGAYEQARPLLRRALRQRRRLHEGPDSTIAATLTLLAQIHQQTGEHEAADSLYRRALSMRRATLGPRHPKTANTLAQLGNLLWYNQGQYAVADSLLHEALRVRRAALGSTHVDVASSLNDLANLHHRRGEYEAAAPYYRDAIAIYREQRGSHPSLGIIQSNYASLLLSRGRYEEAEAVQRNALSVHREHLGAESIDVALGTAKLGRILMEQGRLAAAGPLLREGVEKIRALHDPPHPYTAQSQVHLGRLRLRQGRLDDAERRFTDARRQTERVFPEGHPNRSGPLLGLARVRLARGDAGGAEPLLREGLSLRRTAFGPAHWGVAWAQSVLGHCLAEQGRTEEAAQLLASGIETLRATRPEGDRYLRRAEAYRAQLPSVPD